MACWWRLFKLFPGFEASSTWMSGNEKSGDHDERRAWRNNKRPSCRLGCWQELSPGRQGASTRVAKTKTHNSLRHSSKESNGVISVIGHPQGSPNRNGTRARTCRGSRPFSGGAQPRRTARRMTVCCCLWISRYPSQHSRMRSTALPLKK